MGKSLKRNEDGMAMVLVIMAMLVFSLLGMASLSMANSNVDNSLLEREFQSAFYVAEAGVNYHTEVIKKNIKAAYDSTNTPVGFFDALENNPTTNKTYTTDLFHAQEGYIPEAKVELKRLDIDMSQTNPRTYAVVSHGITDNASRTVVKTITVKWVPKGTVTPDFAVFSRNTLEFGSANIYGSTTNDFAPIGSNTGIKTIGYYGRAGEVSVITEASIDRSATNVQLGTTNIIEEVIYPDPVFPDYPAHNSTLADVNRTDGSHADVYLNDESKVYYIDEFNLAGSSKVTLNIGDKDIKLVVGNFNILQGHIFIEGTGTLKLYIDNINFPAQGDSVINPPDELNSYKLLSNEEIVNQAIAMGQLNDADHPENIEKRKTAANRLEMYYYGSETINITDRKFFHGNLIVKEGTLNFDGSGGFTGSVSTGGPVIVKGDAKITTPLLYAPNSTVEVLGGEFKGPIIGGTVTIGGPTASNPRVYYDPPGTPVPIPGSGDSGQANITEGVAREQ